ncbi:MAG: TerB family tellurite resistance protein [Pseudomonadota bacterium]
MGGLLDRLRGLVVPSAAADGAANAPKAGPGDDRIALGVLLWIVAEADGRFLVEEKAQIEQVLIGQGMGAGDLAVVMASVEQAAKDRIDLYTFTREVAEGLSPAERVEIVKQLYRVACADGSVDHEEVESIRQIAGLLRVPHRDMIDAKVAAKAEYGL